MLSLSLSLCLFLAGAVLGGSVLVVDEDGAGDFTTIQAAVDAAADGDTVLVRSGQYNEDVVVENKALALMAEPGAAPLVVGTLSIVGLQAGATVLVAGLETFAVGDTLPSDVSGFHASGNDGSILVVDCELAGAFGGDHDQAGGYTQGGAGAFVSGSADVTFVRTILRGGRNGEQGCCDPLPPGHDGAPGLHAQDSNVALYDCDARGAWAGAAWVNGGRGGDGCHAVSGTVSSFGTRFEGGQGGNAVEFIGVDLFPGDGGDGYRSEAAAHTRFQDCTFVAGDPGLGLFGEEGEPGAPMQVGGALLQFSGIARGLEVPVPIQAPSSSTLTVHGVANDLVVVMVDGQPAFFFIDVFSGILHVDVPLYVPLGVVPASGALDVPLVFQPISGARSTRTYFLQAIVGAPDGGIELTNPTPLHLYE